MFQTIKQVAEEIRNDPKPILVEAMTFRMRGHEEASGTKYVPQELFDAWEAKDPVRNYEDYLKQENVLTLEIEESLRAKIKEDIETGLQVAFAEHAPESDTSTELSDMYAQSKEPHPQPSGQKESRRFVDAVSDGLKQSLEKHPNLLVMGQDVGEYGGVFKVTEGFVDIFGKERIRNTPLCESAIIGTGLGLSIMNHKAVVEMQFSDFVTCGFNQIVNNLAKSHYRWGQNADVVVRMPTGAGVGAGPYHSQSTEAWFFHTPGLKIVYPSTPLDAKGLLIAAINDRILYSILNTN